MPPRAAPKSPRPLPPPWTNCARPSTPCRWTNCPSPLADAIAPLKSQLDAFARVGASQVSAKVGNNSVTWTQNAAGETLSARATLVRYSPGAKRSSAEVTAQSNVAAKGLADDVGGHIIGHRFTTDQGVKNLFPQNAQFNNSAFKKLENEWGDWIRKKGGRWWIGASSSSGNPTRPDKVAVRYRLTDANGQLYDVRKQEFVNQAGQTFDRRIFPLSKRAEMNQDEALIALCKALPQDPEVVEQPVAKIDTIGEVGPGVVGMRGYSYNLQSQCQLIAPSIDLAPLQQLHTAMQTQSPTGRGWLRCMLRNLP